MVSPLTEPRGTWRAWSQSRLVPTACVVLGLALLVIAGVRGIWGFGIAGLLVMFTYAAVLIATRRRSETMGLLAGDVSDERQARIMTSALAMTAQVWLLVILGGFFYGLITDAEYTGLFSALSAVGGVSFAASVFVYSRRT